MNILYITLENFSLHKGSVVHIKEVVKGLRRLGHHIGLIGHSWEQPEKADSFYNLHRSARAKKQPYLISSVYLFAFLLKVLRPYDIIYARDYHTSLIALIPRIIFKKKLVYEINGLASEEQRMKRDSRLNRLLSYFIRCSERMAARYSDRIVAVTPQIGSYLREEFNCPREKVVVISNGVNTDVFRPLRDEALFSRLKSEMRIPPEGRVVVFVGNLAPWQGVDDLIHVANSLILRIKDIYILIVGDGVLKKKYEEEVTRLGLSDRFLFKGMVHHDQIPIYINLADVCLVLKKKLRSGYSPIKLCEYLACGKPVVASRVEGLEFIETENLGRLVEPGDMRELENVLVELLTDHGKRTEMGRRGLLLARDHFSWDSKALEIENLLRKLA